MADLKTDYLDDILAESMNGKRKFRITKSDGSTEDVTLEDISEYTQKGSNFGAGDINNTNQEVNLKFDSDDVVDPMLATEGGFAADALKTKEAVNNCFQSVSDGKSKIASAITDKGVKTASDATFDTMASNIKKISTGYNKIYYKFQDYGDGNQYTAVDAYDLNVTIEQDGKIKTIHKQTYGTIEAQTFTINGKSSDLNKEISVKKGDVVKINIDYHNASIGQSYGNRGYLIVLYP